MDHKINGATALWFAARKGNVRVIEVLIKHGADLEVKVGGEDSTPLEVAIFNDNFEAAKALLEGGANANAKPFLTKKRESQYVRLFLKHGANVNQKTSEGWTALHDAARHNDVETAGILLENGADINARDNKNETPFDIASQQISIDVLELLLGKKTLPLTSPPSCNLIQERDIRR